MQQPKRGTLDKDSTEQEGREGRESYLSRTVMKARTGDYDIGDVSTLDHPLLAIGDGSAIPRSRITFALARFFKLDMRGARCVWESLNTEIDDADAVNALIPALGYRPIQLWKCSDGRTKLEIPPGGRIPSNLTTIINTFRGSSDIYLVADGRTALERTHHLWLLYGPDRDRIALFASKEERAILKDDESFTKDLDRQRLDWQRKHGGKRVPALWDAICTFHLPISADTDKISLQLSVP